MNAPFPTDPTTSYAPAELDPPPPVRPSRRRRRVVIALLSAIVAAALLLAVLVIPASSDGRANTAGSDSSSQSDADDEGGDDDPSKELSGRTDAGGSTTSTSLDGPFPTGSSPGAFPRGGAPTTSSPHLGTGGDIVLDPGVYESDLVLRNTGGSPLTWNATPEAGDVLAPASGVIPAGSQVIVHLTADPYSSNSKQWTHTAVVHSDGGDAQIAVHGTTLLPAIPDIVGGSQVDVQGNVYVFANGAINVNLLFKNEGDLPLNISFEPDDGALVQGGPDFVIEGGQIEWIGFSLCGQPAPAVLTQHDIPVTIKMDGAYLGSIFLRFHQNAAQATAPC